MIDTIRPTTDTLPPVASVWVNCRTCERVIKINAGDPRECATCKAFRIGWQKASHFLADENGQDVVEYSLLLVLIGVAALIILTSLGVSIGSIFNKISGRLAEADKAIPE